MHRSLVPTSSVTPDPEIATWHSHTWLLKSSFNAACANQAHNPPARAGCWHIFHLNKQHYQLGSLLPLQGMSRPSQLWFLSCKFLSNYGTSPFSTIVHSPSLIRHYLKTEDCSGLLSPPDLILALSVSSPLHSQDDLLWNVNLIKGISLCLKLSCGFLLPLEQKQHLGGWFPTSSPTTSSVWASLLSIPGMG